MRWLWLKTVHDRRFYDDRRAFHICETMHFLCITKRNPDPISFGKNVFLFILFIVYLSQFIYIPSQSNRSIPHTNFCNRINFVNDAKPQFMFLLRMLCINCFVRTKNILFHELFLLSIQVILLILLWFILVQCLLKWIQNIQKHTSNKHRYRYEFFRFLKSSNLLFVDFSYV